MLGHSWSLLYLLVLFRLLCIHFAVNMLFYYCSHKSRDTSLAGAAACIIFVVTNITLSQQNLCPYRLTFVATNTLLLQLHNVWQTMMDFRLLLPQLCLIHVTHFNSELRQCPLTIGSNYCTMQMLFQLLCGAVTRTMSVALPLSNWSQRSPTFWAQLHLPAHDLAWTNLRVQLHLPAHDLFWANLRVQLHLPPLDLTWTRKSV